MNTDNRALKMSDTDLSHSDIASLKMSATGITLIATLAIFAVKLRAWLVTGSVGILTVVMDSVADTIMGGVNFLAVRQGARHADPHHRFGFGKFESLAGACTVYIPSRRRNHDHH